jgi:LuxR family maltose regulon positive regulatory protein
VNSQTARAAPQRLRVIEPKLLLPRVHPGTLRRARLLDLLNGNGTAALTLLDAGVGYGKTTLMRSWCAERPETVIWMTLDAADEDPVRLWTHLATAVERLGEGLGRGALSSLRTRGAPIETAIDELMNGLVSLGRPLTIVLDDLHTVQGDASIRSLGHALRQVPTEVRLLVSTRSDPAIGLARLRARRALTELRALDLAFTVNEASELIYREGIGLSSQSVELLVERTEGWPAGLYLAALWLRGLDRPDEGVQAFAGSARQVGDYLADEAWRPWHRAPGTSFCVPRCWGDSPPSFAMRFWVATTPGQCSPTLRGQTCSWSRWTPEASGTATTTCSVRCCAWNSAATRRKGYAAERRDGVAPSGS